MIIEMMLAVVLCQRPITIIHSDNRDSKMLVTELKRDWSVYDFPWKKYCVEVSEQYRDRVKFIDVNNWRNAKYKLDKYPAIVYGSGEPEYLDELAYYGSTFPLFAFHSFVYNTEVDIRPYKKEINEFEDKYRTKIEKYVRETYPVRFQVFMQNHWGILEDEYETFEMPTIEEFKKAFKDVKFPGRGPLPEYPFKYNPWDRGFLEQLESGKFSKSVLVR